MDFEHFALARDLFYLTGALLGAALGCLLTVTLDAARSTRSRNRRISVMFFIVSGAVVAFSLSLIVSGNRVVGAGLTIPAGICALAGMLAVRFPRAVAYPLILLSGLLFVWAGYSFLRFPPVAADIPIAIILPQGGHTAVSLPGTPPPKTRRPYTADSRDAGQIEIAGDVSALEFSAAVISFNRLYPLIGGESRGGVTLIRRSEEILYTDPRMNDPRLLSYYARFGIGYSALRERIPAALTGTKTALFYDAAPPEKKLRFKPR